MPLGTPLTHAQRQPPKQRGRPPKLTEETSKAILAALRTHQRRPVAARLGGIHEATMTAWTTRGTEARLFLEDGGRLGDLTVHDRACLDFLAEVEVAESQAEGRAVRGWMSAGLERQTERTTRQRFAGMDDSGHPIMVTEETVKEIPPDASLLIKWLERRVPAYRPTAPADVSIDITLRAASLAERVRAATISTTSTEIDP